RTKAYTYDSLYRLIQETISADPHGSTGAITYTYDPVGNRLTRASTVTGISAQTFSYDANDRLVSDAYDGNGNTVSSGTNTYGYDFEDRLNRSGGGSLSVVYDGDGNRVSKTVGTVTTQYLVDDRNPTRNAQVLEEIAGG